MMTNLSENGYIHEFGFRNLQEQLENNIAYNIFTTVPVVFYHKEETDRGLLIKIKEIKTLHYSTYFIQPNIEIQRFGQIL